MANSIAKSCRKVALHVLAIVSSWWSHNIIKVKLFPCQEEKSVYDTEFFPTESYRCFCARI